MSGSKYTEEDVQGFIDRVRSGPQDGEYVPGSPSENYEPATITVPATSIGQPADPVSYVQLTDDETRPQYEDPNS